MAFAVTPVAAKDGTGTTIAGGVEFVDISGTGAGPWIITKVLLDPAGANAQFVLANNAAKTDLSSIAGTATPTGHGTAANSLRVELPTDGTGVIASVGTITNPVAVTGTFFQATQPVSGIIQEADANNATAITGTGSASVTSATTLFSVDTTGYRLICIQVTSAGTTCTITYEGSNDNSTWLASPATNQSGNPNPQVTSTTTGIFVIPAMARYCRARVSTYTSGTVTVAYSLRTNTFPGTAPVSVIGIASVSATLAAIATGGYTYAHVAAGTATTVIKATAGTLHSITFGGAATSLNTTTIYDNATGAGTVIGIPSVTALVAPTTLIYDIAFTTGLTIITATANGADMTVAFK